MCVINIIFLIKLLNTILVSIHRYIAKNFLIYYWIYNGFKSCTYGHHSNEFSLYNFFRKYVNLPGILLERSSGQKLDWCSSSLSKLGKSPKGSKKGKLTTLGVSWSGLVFEMQSEFVISFVSCIAYWGKTYFSNLS